MSRRKQVGASLAALVMAAAAIFGVSQIAGGNPSDPTATSSASSSTSPSLAQATATPTHEPTSSPPASDKPTPTPEPSPEPAEPKAVLEPGDSGDEVRELQARLKQLDWYEPKINGAYDETTGDAVKGFQEKRGFDDTGVVTKKTWNTLVDMTREPTDDEMHNRLTAGPAIIGPDSDELEIRELQARLKQIGWFDHDVTGTYGDVTMSSVSEFQAKREIPETGEVDQRTWDRLVAMTHEPTDDELHNREKDDDTDAGNLDPRCLTGRAMCADKSANTLSWVVDGEVQLTLAVRFGCNDARETREGEFNVGWKSRDHVSKLYDTPMPFAMFFSGGQAVHYSEDFANRGYDGCSHGCINVKNYDDIAWLFDQVQVGDKVVVYWS